MNLIKEVERKIEKDKLRPGEAAKLLGLSRATLWRVLNKPENDTSAQTQRKLMRFIGVNIEEPDMSQRFVCDLTVKEFKQLLWDALPH
jgi:predicted DNA-binding protein (UPF0251 family)